MTEYIKGQLDRIQLAGGQVSLQLRNAEGETHWLNITSEQELAIEKILLGEEEPHPADNVSYAPCITGKIEIGDAVSEFMLPIFNDSVRYSQWGANGYILSPRVDLLEKLADAAAEWASENLCRTCGENLLDDGEGYDGECGDCADKTEAALHTPGTRVIWTDPDGGQCKVGVIESVREDSDEVYLAFDDGGYAEALVDELEKEVD